MVQLVLAGLSAQLIDGLQFVGVLFDAPDVQFVGWGDEQDAAVSCLLLNLFQAGVVRLGAVRETVYHGGVSATEKSEKPRVAGWLFAEPERLGEDDDVVGVA